jgi:hypothetical protein
MEYKTVVTDFFARFPKLHAVYQQKFGYMEDESPGPFVVFGSVLIPALEEGLAAGNLAMVLPICAFLEDIAESARTDSSLESLLRLEIGEWLGGMDNEAFLTPWLGQETKRICGYVPGLATQRRDLRNEAGERTLKNRARRLLLRLTGKWTSGPIEGP